MTTTRRYARWLAVALLAGATACADSGEAPRQGAIQADGELPAGHPPIASSPYAHDQAAPAGGGPAAVVLEVQDVTDYTYARVASGGEEIWVAGPKSGLAEGDTISLGGAMGMTDFSSAELDRTFESILFLDAWRAPSAAPAQNRGSVLEIIPAASYTYIRVDTEDGELWLAGPRVALEEGQVIAWSDGMAMRDFASKTLERTFDVIYFVDGVQVVP